MNSRGGRAEVEREIRQAAEAVSNQQPSAYTLRVEEQSELEKEKIQKASMALGINIVGKDVAALREEIRKALGSQETSS